MSKNTAGEDLDIYTPASLSKYSFRKRILIRLADYLIYAVIFFIGKTIRFEPISGWKDLDVKGLENWEVALERNQQAAMAFWHECIFLNTYFWQQHDAVVLVSKSFDGEYISRVAQRFGYGVIRGSSSRGGVSALGKMIRLSKRGLRMIFTVDGPRGPRHRVKKGVVVVAKEAGIPIAPMLAAAKSRWIVNNWDKTQIPKPFTRGKVFVAEPVFVPPDADDEIVEEKRLELERKLDELVVRGEEWRVAKN